MELGNLMFGNSRGEFEFPDRLIADSGSWRNLLLICDCNEYGCYMGENKDYLNYMNGFSCKVFEINPYYWGDCTCGADDNPESIVHSEDCLFVCHNFIYYPTNFCIDWYKHPFRDSYMNQNLSTKEIKHIFKRCRQYLIQYGFVLKE